jgi:hypothetical protein
MTVTIVHNGSQSTVGLRSWWKISNKRDCDYGRNVATEHGFPLEVNVSLQAVDIVVIADMPWERTRSARWAFCGGSTRQHETFLTGTPVGK